MVILIIKVRYVGYRQLVNMKRNIKFFKKKYRTESNVLSYLTSRKRGTKKVEV